MSDRTPHPPGGVFSVCGRPVPRVGYGMGQLTRRAAASGDRSPAVALLRRAFDLGIRHFDTAQFYSDGLANLLLREAFAERRDEVFLVSKAGARPVSDGALPLTLAQRPHELRQAVEENLRTLSTDRLDVVYLRRADFLPGLLAEGEQTVPLDDQLAELVALRDEGKITGIGLSHVTLDQISAALPAGIVCVQNIFNLLDRSGEPLLTLCRERGIAWVPYFPLGGGGGYTALPSVADDAEVRAVAREMGATPSQVGLAWLLTLAPNTMVIPGTGSIEHLIENTSAGDLVLDAEAMRRLDARAGAGAGNGGT